MLRSKGEIYAMCLLINYHNPKRIPVQMLSRIAAYADLELSMHNLEVQRCSQDRQMDEFAAAGSIGRNFVTHHFWSNSKLVSFCGAGMCSVGSGVPGLSVEAAAGAAAAGHDR